MKRACLVRVWPSGDLRNPRSFISLRVCAKGECQRGDRKACVPGA